MARALIVGCGGRGRALGRELIEAGWAVRGTTRDPAGFDEIEAAGIEPALADPDSPGSIVEIFGDITVIVWLMGSAEGSADNLKAIHGPRLERLLEKVVDSPVRGVAYEASGTVTRQLISSGRAVLDDAAERWQIPVGYIEVDPGQQDAWIAASVEAVMAAIRS